MPITTELIFGTMNEWTCRSAHKNEETFWEIFGFEIILKHSGQNIISL